jgi:hypothetical protein
MKLINKFFQIGSDPNHPNDSKNLLRVVCEWYPELNTASFRKEFLEMLVRNGFDLTSLSGKGFKRMNKKKYIYGLLWKQNISNFIVFSKVYNRNVERPLSIVKA